MSITVIEPVKKQNELSIIAEKIDTGLQAFEQRKAELIELKEQAHGLKITSIDDTISIKLVSAFRKKLKSTRNDIERESKGMRDPLTKMSKFIISKENELVAIIEPTEKDLLAQEKWIDDELDNIKQAATDERLEKLSFTGKSFDRAYIGSLDNETFKNFLVSQNIEFEQEQAHKAEQERLRLEEAAKLEADREEIERLLDKQQNDRAILHAENERIRKERQELLNQKREIRISKLLSLGMYESSNFYSYNFNKDCVIGKDEIESMDDNVFSARILNLSENIKSAIYREEKEKQETINKATEDARLQAIEDTRIEAETKERELQEAAAKAEREAALQPDKEKLLAFVNKLGSLEFFETNDEKVKLILNNVLRMINDIEVFIHRKIEEL